MDPLPGSFGEHPPPRTPLYDLLTVRPPLLTGNLRAGTNRSKTPLTASRYDVVFMDLPMPYMDGLEATRRIRVELPADEQPVIIAMTANAMAEDRAECLLAGMDDYMSKPFRKDALAEVLARFAGRSPHGHATV